MAQNQNLSLKAAVKARTMEDLSSTHLTTLEIGQIVPLWAVETLISGKYPVRSTHFSRLAPLVKPTYGKMYFKTVTMFIPYYQVAGDNFDGWMNGNRTVNGEVASSRYIKRRDILDMFTLNGVSTEVSAADVATGSWFDFRCKNGSTDKYYKFNSIAKYYIKVLNSLGYVIPMNGNTNPSNTWYTSGYGSKNISALPIIAFAKGYNDWMSQSQRFNTSVLTKFLFAIKHDKTMSYGGNTVYDASTHCITKMGLLLLLQSIRLMYENDYFTEAWQHPNAPIEGQEYSLNGNEQEQSVDNNQLYDTQDDETENKSINNTIWKGDNGTYVSTDVDFTVPVTGGEEEPEAVGSIRITLAQRTMRWLDAFDRYVKRNNYAGSKDVQQIYARFGIKVEDFKANYSHIISKSKAPIQIGDITATAQDFVAAGSENNVAIGDYAGKGIMSNNERFNYKANEVGLLCTYAWITVAPMNVYGEDRMVKRVTPLDFYKPEFDGEGPEAISVDEMYNNPRIWSNTNPNAVYGFVEKYNSYRYGKDRITGDFRKMPLDTGTYKNTGTEMNTWHLGRFLDTQLQDQSLVAQNPNINQLHPVNSEYNRIFSVTTGDVDHFYITSQVECKAILPILSNNQTPGLGEGKTVVAKNGNEIN